MSILTILASLLGLSLAGGPLFKGRFAAVTEFVVTSYRENLEGPVGTHTEDWLVFHYSSMCGQCHRFAPEFASIAASFKGRPIRFGAINLNHIDNNIIARDKWILDVPYIELIRIERSPRGSKRVIEVLEHDTNAIRSKLNDLFPAAVGVPVIPSIDVLTLDTPTKKLKTDSNSFIRDATTALSSVFHVEVFRGGAESLSLSDMDHLSKVLDACQATWPSEKIRAACSLLRTQVIDELQANISLTRSTWEKFLKDSGLPSPSNSDLESCPTMTCALWRVLHIFSLGLGGNPADRSLSGSDAMHAIRSLVDKFFSCQDCRMHFLQHFDACDFGRCDADNPSWKQTSLWLWRFHNAVTARVHPGRSAWPSQKDCPNCDGDENRTYEFLVSQFTPLDDGKKVLSFAAEEDEDRKTSFASEDDLDGKLARGASGAFALVVAVLTFVALI